MFKIKYNKDSSIQKHKTRIIAKTYSQQLIVDFFETFAPKIKIVLTLVAILHLQVLQLDVKSAFLNRELQEEVSVEQPPIYEWKGKTRDKIYRLYKAFYELKHALRTWNIKINLYFHQNRFEKSQHKPSLYIKKKREDFLMVCLYVDDLIYAGTNKNMVA